jgi:protein tyrosine/serine phosphatase
MVKKIRLTFYAIAGLMVLFLLINGILSYYPNFYPVIPKVVYRSGQLTEHRFNLYIRQYKIKSIINLRGAEPDMPWYQMEQRIVKKNGVKHYDIPMSAMGANSPANLALLIKTLEEAPKPVLIHCWRGADRTGFAAAAALIVLNDDSLQQAKQQISYKYGAISSETTGKIELEYYEQWLAANHYQSSRQRFLQWIQQLPNDKAYAKDTK